MSPGLTRAEDLSTLWRWHAGKKGDGERAGGSPIEQVLRISWTRTVTDSKIISSFSELFCSALLGTSHYLRLPLRTCQSLIAWISDFA